MKISDILKPEAVIFELEARDKLGVLQELATALHQANPAIPRQDLRKTLEKREELGSTGIGSGVAIPHGKLENLQTIMAAFGKSQAGIDFDAQDGELSHLFFALVAPENSAGQHLKALAKLSRLLKNPYFRETLLKAKSTEQLYQIIIDEDNKH